MNQVMTVLGPVPADQLGLTSMHEHILVDGRVWHRILEPLIPAERPIPPDAPVALDNIGLLRRNIFLTADNLVLDDEATMCAEVADFRASGGSAMLDMSCPGLRLDLPATQRIARATGVHIIATTGLYIKDSWPDAVRDLAIDELAGLMVRDIEVGIGDTGIRAGHIGELGMMDLGERDVRLLRAAARASIATGLSVSVHQETSRSHGASIVDILVREGMDPQRIILCHVDGFVGENRVTLLIQEPSRARLDLDYPRRLLDRGVNVSFDCFGHLWDEELGGTVMIPDWQRIAALVALTDAGYAPQIVLGTDTFIKILLRRYGGEGYCRLTRYAIPMLRAYGVSEYDIRQMSIENAARLLAPAS